jgi:hypothetical protein
MSRRTFLAAVGSAARAASARRGSPKMTADQHGLVVIEDCAHALLARYGGRYVGAWGRLGIFSFNYSKQMSARDGGVAFGICLGTIILFPLRSSRPTWPALWPKGVVRK